MDNTTKIIDLSGLEKALYPTLDACGIKGKGKLKQTIKIGDVFYVDINIKNYNNFYISNSSKITKHIKISLNFRENTKSILRLDNDHGQIHYDLDSKHQKHINYSSVGNPDKLSQVICDTFESAKKILEKEYPDYIIKYWN